jgi:dihydrofolate reductase
MRKIVAGLFVSLDGVVESPETWTGRYFSEDVGRPGRNINVSGSSALVGWLLRQGLLDHLDLLVFPLPVGGGKHLFEANGDQVALKLAKSEAFSNGVPHLAYQPAGT